MPTQIVLQRLSDPTLPVHTEASKSLHLLIEAEGSEATLLHVLPHILYKYLHIITDIGNNKFVGLSNFSREPSRLYPPLSHQPYLYPYCWRQPSSSPRWLTWYSRWSNRVRIWGSIMIMMASLMMTPMEMYWIIMRILMGFTIIRMLPESLMRPIWIHWISSQAARTMLPSSPLVKTGITILTSMMSNTPFHWWSWSALLPERHPWGCVSEVSGFVPSGTDWTTLWGRRYSDWLAIIKRVEIAGFMICNQK